MANKLREKEEDEAASPDKGYTVMSNEKVKEIKEEEEKESAQVQIQQIGSKDEDGKKQ